MGFNIRNAMASGAAGVADVAGTYAKTEIAKAATLDIERVRAEIQADRDARLHEQAVSMQRDVIQLHARQLQKDDQDFRSRESREGRTHQETLQNNLLKHQKELAENLEKATNERHRQSLGVQYAQLKATQEQVSLVPQADGRILKVRKDGESAGYLSDQSGNVIQGPKNVSDGAKLLIEGNTRVMAALAKDAADALDENVRNQINQRIADLQNENKRLAGMSDGSEPNKAASKGARWDNESGNVILDGRVIGTAKSKAEAKKLADDHRAGHNTAAARPQQQQPAGMINRERQPSYGAVLDQLNPRPEQPYEEPTPMVAP